MPAFPEPGAAGFHHITLIIKSRYFTLHKKLPLKVRKVIKKRKNLKI
jgi:hypothetical protein